MVALTIALSLLGSPSAGQTEPKTDTRDIEFFETRIRPILHERCYDCHSARAKKTRGGLRLDTRAGLLTGGDTGPVVVPGTPEDSSLIRAISYENVDIEMPPSGKLPEREIALLVEWVKRGAPYPATKEDDKSPAARTKTEVDWTSARSFWSFQMPRRHPLPAVRDTGWARGRIDTFILARLEQNGLSPSPPAERRTLIRRATFDVTGLPPTPSEVASFVADERPDAYEFLVDRLLQSPAYGERWGRFWLDLARYCDTPADWSISHAKPHLYRDWVIHALNDDMPYDDFVKRQLATDQLPKTGRDDLPALGFLGLSPVYWKELRLSPEVLKTIIAEEWEERIDTVSRTFLGLTAACARCHDHKFDPITTRDYYALAGVFASSQVVDRPVFADVDETAWIKAHADVVALKTKIDEIKATRPPPSDSEKQIAELTRQMERIRESTPNFDGLAAHAVIDSSIDVIAVGPNLSKLVYQPGVASDIAVQIRGNPSSPGDVIPRRFFALFTEGEPSIFKNGSGRLELAQAIVEDGAALSSRVIVNRIWRHHFGRGLVETPSNFGAQGERPSHPELLGDLAASFMANGWSMKRLHRKVMLSATYRQASDPDPTKHAVDPENLWLWRMNRRRLEVEAWRDAMLQVSGELERPMGGSPTDLSDTNRRRTIYATVARRDIDALLRLHDFPEPTSHSANRDLTTTPLQQLFVLNSSFMRQRASALAKHLGDAAETDSLVKRAHEMLYARLPTPEEMRLATDYLASDASSTRDELLTQYLQVILGNNAFFFID